MYYDARWVYCSMISDGCSVVSCEEASVAPCRVPALINQGAHSMAPIMIIHADGVAAMVTVVLLLLILVVFLMMIVVRWYNNVSIMVRQTNMFC